ncbi:prosaposin [Nematostella vectensis]|uniref:prosaposin n=1 Tax=Nematostella vectensis TaxID=45351 RepID=UPI0013904B74|nr:prosaposin [Nematostella vectensis]
MKCLLVVLCAFAATTHAKFVGNPRCVYGPAYWCRSLEHAQECDAVEHCKNSVWKYNQDTCAICEAVVGKVKDALDDKSMEGKVKAILDEICDKDGGFFAGECKKVVDTYFTMIISQLDIILQNPKQVCTTLGLCSAEAEEVLKRLLWQALEGGDQGSCEICELVVDKIRGILQNNALQQKVQATLEQFCKTLGPLAAQCKSGVDQYFPIVIAHLNTLLQDSKQVCTELGLCIAGNRKAMMDNLIQHVLRSLPSVHNSEVCSICELAVDKIRDVIGDNSIQAEIKGVLEDACVKEGGAYAGVCKALVDQYFPIIISHLDKLVQNSKQVCTALGLCSADRWVCPRPDDAPQCVLCEFVMKEIKQLLAKDTTQQGIEKALMMVCSIMPETIRNNCDKFVTEYTPIIMSLLLEEVDPAKVCSMIGLCNSPAAALVRMTLVRQI